MYIFHFWYHGEKSWDNKEVGRGGRGSVEISPLLTMGEGGVENWLKTHQVIKDVFHLRMYGTTLGIVKKIETFIDRSFKHPETTCEVSNRSSISFRSDSV